MEEELLAKILGNIGVPAAVCFYTLFRVNQTLQNLTDAISKLTVDNDKRLDKIEHKTEQLSYELKALQRKGGL